MSATVTLLSMEMFKCLEADPVIIKAGCTSAVNPPMYTEQMEDIRSLNSKQQYGNTINVCSFCECGLIK